MHLNFRGKAVAQGGIQSNMIESQDNDGGGQLHGPSLAVPQSGLNSRGRREDKAVAELCLWFLDNFFRRQSCCFYIWSSGANDTWEFGYERNPEASHESPKAKHLAEQTFGFKEPAHAKSANQPPCRSSTRSAHASPRCCRKTGSILDSPRAPTQIRSNFIQRSRNLKLHPA